MCYNRHFHAHSGGVRFSTKPCNLPTRDVGMGGFWHIIHFNFFFWFSENSFPLLLRKTLFMIYWDGVAASFNKDTYGTHLHLWGESKSSKRDLHYDTPTQGKTLEKRAYRRLGDWRRTSTSFYSPCFSGRACASQSVVRAAMGISEERAAIYHWTGEDRQARRSCCGCDR